MSLQSVPPSGPSSNVVQFPTKTPTRTPLVLTPKSPAPPGGPGALAPALGILFASIVLSVLETPEEPTGGPTGPLINSLPPGYITPPSPGYRPADLPAGVSYRVFWDATDAYGRTISVAYNGGAYPFFNVQGPFSISRGTEPYGYPDGRKIIVTSLSGSGGIPFGPIGELTEIPPPYERSGANMHVIRQGTFSIVKIERINDGRDMSVEPPPDIPPRYTINYPDGRGGLSIINNQTINNGPTINNFPIAPTGFPNPTGPIVPGYNPNPSVPGPNPSVPGPNPSVPGPNPSGPEPNPDSPLIPSIVPVPFGMPISVGTGTNISVSDPVREAALRVNPDAFKVTNTQITPNGNVRPGTNSNSASAPSPVTNMGNINFPSFPYNENPQVTPPLFTPAALNPTTNRPSDRSSPVPAVSQTPPGNNCCTPTPIQNQLNDINKKLSPTELVDWSILTTINSKLGPQVNGGISQFMQRIHRNGMIDRTLNTISTVASLHNAAMLTRDLGGTLMDTTSQVIAAVGIKDSEGNAYDFNQIIGGTVQNWIKGVIGADNFNNVSQTWIRANRILTAGSNLLDSVRSMSHTIIESQEIVGGWVAKIGNGMSEDGIVSDDTLPWFPENPNFKNPLFRVEQSISNLTDAADSVNQLASAVIETQELYGQINRNYTEFKNEIAAAGTAKRNTETTKKNESVSPAIDNIDLKEGTPPNGN